MTGLMSMHGWLAILCFLAVGVLGLFLVYGLLRKKQKITVTVLSLASIAALPALASLFTHWGIDYGFKTLEPFNSAIIAMAASEDGTLLVAADSEGAVKSYDMTKAKTMGCKQFSDVRELHVTPGVAEATSRIAVIGDGGALQLSDSTLGQQPCATSRTSTTNPNTRFVISGTADGGVFAIRERFDAKGGASGFEIVTSWPEFTNLPIVLPTRPTTVVHTPLNKRQINYVFGFVDGRVAVVDADSFESRLRAADQSVPLIVQVSAVDPLHNTPITRIAANASGLIVTADLEGHLGVWHIDEKSGVPVLKSISEGTTGFLGHSDFVRSAVFSPDGTQIVTTSEDGTARVWNAATRQAIGAPLKHEEAVNSAAYSPDGTKIVTASEDTTARIWDAATHQAIGGPLKHESAVNSAVFSPDGTKIVTASNDVTAWVWDATTLQEIGEPLMHGQAVRSAAFSPDGTKIMTVSEGAVRIWDVGTHGAIGEPMKHGNIVFSAAFSPDGTKIVTASEDRSARVWDAATHQALGEPLRHGQAVRSAGFSPDGTKIVTASDDRTARIWDDGTHGAIGEPMKHGNIVFSAMFSPDGTKIVTAFDDKTTRIWNLNRIDNASCLGCLAISLSEDGKSVEVIDYLGRIQRFDAVSGERRFESKTLAHEHAIALKSGRVLEIRGDGSVGLIEADGTWLKLSGHSAMITQAVELADDRIVTGATDGSIRVLAPRMHRIIAAIDFWPGLTSLSQSVWALLSNSGASNQTTAVDALPEPVPAVFVAAATFGQEWDTGQTGNTPDKVILAEYYSKYWLPANCHELPDKIARLQFDAALNHGPRRAVMLLQAALDLPTDGIFGPTTQSQAKNAPEDDLALRYLDQRLEFINSLNLSTGIANGFTKRFQALAKELGLAWPRSASAS